MARLSTRIPVIALDYMERHKAVEKELLVDYDNGNIYVVSKDDKSVIIDITSKIKEQMENMTGDKIEIEIEGIGKVNLTDIIKKIQFDIQNTVQVVYTGEDIHYVGKENILDEESVEVVNKRIQIKGFSSAEPHMIPRKGLNGEIEWINMLLTPDDNIPNVPGGPGGDIIPPGNPDDGNSLFVDIIEPMNDKIYLRASRRQKSINITRNCIVVIPRVLDQFCEIEWYVICRETAPLFKFSDNVLWADIASTQPKPNTHHVYKFKSWDAGETWIGEIVYYSKTATDVSGFVNIDYLKENYFDKKEIVDDYYNKEEVDEKIDAMEIPDLGDIDLSNYYNKQEMEDKYYDKEQITVELGDLDNSLGAKMEILNRNLEFNIREVRNEIPDVSSKVDRIELDNYYNKDEIDDKLDAIEIPGDGDIIDLDEYVKHEYLDDNYHNKTVVDKKIQKVRNEIPDVSSKVDRIELEDYYNKEEIDEKLDSIEIPGDGDVNIDLDEYVKHEYLEDKYYDKDEVDEKIDSIEVSGVDLSNYYNKQEMEDKYYDKEQIEERIDDINAVDPTDYYNKEEVEELLEQEYYNKEHIDSEHYNRQEVDKLLSWKEGMFKNKLSKYRK